MESEKIKTSVYALNSFRYNSIRLCFPFSRVFNLHPIYDGNSVQSNYKWFCYFMNFASCCCFRRCSRFFVFVISFFINFCVLSFYLVQSKPSSAVGKKVLRCSSSNIHTKFLFLIKGMKGSTKKKTTTAREKNNVGNGKECYSLDSRFYLSFNFTDQITRVQVESVFCFLFLLQSSRLIRSIIFTSEFGFLLFHSP